MPSVEYKHTAADGVVIPERHTWGLIAAPGLVQQQIANLPIERVSSLALDSPPVRSPPHDLPHSHRRSNVNPH